MLLFNLFFFPWPLTKIPDLSKGIKSCTGFVEPQETFYEACCAFIPVLGDAAHSALGVNSEDLVAVIFA